MSIVPRRLSSSSLEPALSGRGQYLRVARFRRPRMQKPSCSWCTCFTSSRGSSSNSSPCVPPRSQSACRSQACPTRRLPRRMHPVQGTGYDLRGVFQTHHRESYISHPSAELSCLSTPHVSTEVLSRLALDVPIPPGVKRVQEVQEKGAVQRVRCLQDEARPM